MEGNEKKDRREHLLKDLVELHQSLGGGKADDVGPRAVDPADEAADALSRAGLFVDHLPMGVLFADIVRDRYRHPVGYKVRSANRSYAELIGRSHVAVLESGFFDVLPGGEADWATELEAVAAKGRPAQGFSPSPRHGRLLHVFLFLPRRDTLAVVLDEPVTDGASLRGTALDQLRQADQILSSLPVLIARFQPGGRLTYANDAYRLFFEMAPEALCAHGFMPSVASGFRDFVRSRMEMICRDLPSVTYEAPFDLAAGRRWVQWTDSGVFDANGVLVEYQSVGVDITGLKERMQQEHRLAGLLRDLLAYHADRRREWEGSQTVSSVDLRALADENRALKRELERLEKLTIQGALQICRRCSRIHDEEGHWMLPPLYFELHTAATVGSGVCPYCRRKAERESDKNADPSTEAVE